MQQDELTFHPSYNQQVHLFVKGYLLSGLEQQDQFSYLAELFTFLYQVRTRIVWMAVLCPLSSICLAVYLLHACGRQARSGGHRPGLSGAHPSGSVPGGHRHGHLAAGLSRHRSD